MIEVTVIHTDDRTTHYTVGPEPEAQFVTWKMNASHRMLIFKEEFIGPTRTVVPYDNIRYYGVAEIAVRPSAPESST